MSEVPETWRAFSEKQPVGILADPETLRACTKCGAAFISASRLVKYCRPCKREEHNKNAAKAYAKAKRLGKR